MNVLYTAKARATGGRDGRATSADGHPDLLLKPPPAMGGPADHPEATNPEELFAAVAQLLAYVYRVAGARRALAGASA